MAGTTNVGPDDPVLHVRCQVLAKTHSGLGSLKSPFYFFAERQN